RDSSARSAATDPRRSISSDGSDGKVGLVVVPFSDKPGGTGTTPGPRTNERIRGEMGVKVSMSSAGPDQGVLALVVEHVADGERGDVLLREDVPLAVEGAAVGHVGAGH